MQEQYNPNAIEPQLQQKWQQQNTYKCQPNQQDKFYCLAMFPYPSGNIHVGHARNYTITDTIARFWRLHGKNVLQPMGWDAFGLPAENAALKHKVAPAKWTYQNIQAMKQQLQRLGFAYDWSRELITCKPDYYRWEQWLFIQLYQRGLIYQKDALVNWDPIDNTVLANEQVVNGRGWRSGALVERRQIKQWFVKITDYAEELLKGLDNLPGWPESVKTMQRNWIGRSHGCEVDFVVDSQTTLTVFTTRVDTLMGATYLAIAPEHQLAKTASMQNPRVAAFIKTCQNTKTSEADIATQEKLGIDTGFTAIHPLSKQPIPVWIANYVLIDYGQGALMAVPAHDERDYEFALKYQLPIKEVILSPEDKSPYTELGTLINSGEFTGQNSTTAKQNIAQALTDINLGRAIIQYRLRDWGVSRQRYWGAPIPMVYCQACGCVPVAEQDLPVVLPEEVEITGSGSILQQHQDFYHCLCPVCQQPAHRETDTLDTFFESSWYYARFACPDAHDMMLSPEADYWTPVDHYVGGVEHAVLHLLYARFFHKVLRDLKLLSSDEPFTKLLTQGMVLKDGQKMSKSLGNTIDPNELIQHYGADTVRMFVLFAAPPEQSLEWSDDAVEGCYRFLKRLWALVFQHVTSQFAIVAASTSHHHDDSDLHMELRNKIHQTIAKVTDDISRRLTFNTAIAAIMSLLNNVSKFVVDSARAQAIRQEALESIVVMLWPVVPHICEELWQQLGHDDLSNASWPKVDSSALVSKETTWVLQVNGKTRAQLTCSVDLTTDMVKQQACEHPKIQPYLQQNRLHKCIVVANKLINFVIK